MGTSKSRAGRLGLFWGPSWRNAVTTIPMPAWRLRVGRLLEPDTSAAADRAACASGRGAWRRASCSSGTRAAPARSSRARSCRDRWRRRPRGLPVASSARCSAPNEPAFAEDGGALERVAQLADVAGPVVPEQRLPGVAREARRRPCERSADVLQQRLAERQDVVGALAQRRDRDVEHLQPIEQVLAEVAAFHGLRAGRGWSRRSRGCSPSASACRRAAGTRAPAARAGTSPAPPGSSRRLRRGTARRRRPARSARAWPAARR